MNLRPIDRHWSHKWCLSKRIRRLPHKVLTSSASEQALRMVDGDLMQLIGHCTTPLRIGDYCYVVPFIVLSDCVSGVILGWDVLFSHDALIDCLNGEVHLNDYEAINSPFAIFQRAAASNGRYCNPTVMLTCCTQSLPHSIRSSWYTHRCLGPISHLWGESPLGHCCRRLLDGMPKLGL